MVVEVSFTLEGGQVALLLMYHAIYVEKLIILRRCATANFQYNERPPPHYLQVPTPYPCSSLSAM